MYLCVYVYIDSSKGLSKGAGTTWLAMVLSKGAGATWLAMELLSKGAGELVSNSAIVSSSFSSLITSPLSMVRYVQAMVRRATYHDAVM